MAGFQPPPRVKNALDHRKLNLSAPCPTDAKKKSNLIWGLYLGNPRLTVYTGDAEGTKVSAALDAPVFFAFISMMNQALTAPPEWKAKLVNKNYTWFNRKRSENPEVVSELIIGKDKDGQIWISVIDNKATKVRFFFAPNDFHSFHVTGPDGTMAPMTKEQVSVHFTSGYIRLLENVVSDLFINQWPEVEADYKKKAEEAAAKRNGDGGGGYNKPAPAASAAVEEDIPW